MRLNRNMPVAFLLASTAGVAIAYAACFAGYADRTTTVFLMVVSIATMLISAMSLGALRNGSLGRLVVPFTVVWLVIIVGFLIATLLPPETATSPALILGVPRRAAIVLYGIGLLPLLGMPIAYALTFDESTLADVDLAELRSKAQRILDEEQQRLYATTALPHDGINAEAGES